MLRHCWNLATDKLLCTPNLQQTVETLQNMRERLAEMKNSVRRRTSIEERQRMVWLQPWYSNMLTLESEADNLLAFDTGNMGTFPEFCCYDLFRKRVVKCIQDLSNLGDLQKQCLDSLPNQKLKHCFFYCILFPKHFRIPKDNLVDCWICEGLLHGQDNRACNAHEEGYRVINVLVDLGLLQDTGKYVKLHCLVRDTVLSIVKRHTCRKHVGAHYWVAAGTQLTQVPTISRRITRLSLMENSIRSLTEEPEWSTHLSTLFLCYNQHLSVISDEFFQFMNSLTVLDLSNTGIQEVPMGISKLTSLQYLNISHSWIEQLPVEMMMLEKLKCLYLEHNDLLRVVSRQVISSLSRLQVLRMFSCGVSLISSEDNMLSYTNNHVNELQELEHLNSLSITITSYAAFQSLFNISKSRTCTKALSLKCFWGTSLLDISLLAIMKDLEMLEIYHIDYLEELKVDLTIKETEIQEASNLDKLAMLRERSFNALQELTVGKCFHLRELTWVVLAPNLKVLKVIDCKKLEEIISIRKLNVVSGHLNPFSKLEVLVLEMLPKLKTIYRTALPFPCLEKIKVLDCPLLNKLPLNSDSVMGREVIIEAKEHWWNGVDLEDDATRIALLRCFRQIS